MTLICNVQITLTGWGLAKAAWQESKKQNKTKQKKKCDCEAKQSKRGDQYVVCWWHVHSTSACIDFSISISNRHQSVWIWFSSHPHLDEALFTHVHKYVKRGKCVSLVCNYHPGNQSSSPSQPPPPHTHSHTHICWPRRLTKVHSSDLVLFICLCFSLIFIILPSARAFPLQTFPHFSSRLLADRHRPR